MNLVFAGVVAALLFAGCTSSPPKQTVAVDFMYYKDCGYCTQMEPVLANVANQFGPQVKIRVLDAQQRGMNNTVTNLYEQYKAEGKFGGFPTLVADGKSALVGLRSEAEVKTWLCAQFVEKPQAC